MKKIISMLLAVAMLSALLVGCVGGGNDDTVALGEDPNTCPEDTYEINWYIMADAQKDVESVEAAVNEYLKDKINATVKMNILPSAQYSQKLGTMINAGEYFDLCFVARWMLNYIPNSRSGAFFGLNDYIDTYMPKTKALYNDGVLEASSVDGELYALPVNKEMASNYGWIYRKDIAEKYDIDMSQYKSFESLEPVLKMLKEKEPSIKYPIDWAADTNPTALYRYENWIYKDGTYPDDKVVNTYATPEFAQACKTARDFYVKGYVRPDVLTATDQNQRMREGNTFVMLAPLKPGKADEMFEGSPYEFEQVDVVEPIMDYLAGTGSMQAVSATSKNPARVMRFLELLNTDEYLNNLIIHGIEGKHYTKKSDKIVSKIDSSGYDLYANSWSIANIFITYLTDNDDPNKLEALKAYNDSAKDSRANRFILKEDVERDRIKSEVSAVTKKYKKQCTMGAVDPEPVLKEYLEQLEKVGLSGYLESIQAEYDEYLKTLK